MIPLSRAPFMVDVVVIAMAVVLPLMSLSVFQAKKLRNYKLHKSMQLVLSWTLLVTVILFECELRMVDWREMAKPSPFFPNLVFFALGAHVMVATTTIGIWLFTVLSAARAFKERFVAGNYNAYHRVLGWWTFGSMTLTALTGWLFFYLAFIAE